MKTRYLARRVKEITSIETAEALWHLLKTHPFKAGILMQHPHYSIFTVRKRNGSPRTIEDPSDELKLIQDRLNDFLQPLYFFNKTDAAYGYIIRPNEMQEPRNILTNAKKHCNNKYLLNIDVKDFFHYVKWQVIYESLKSFPFHLHDVIAESICHICTLDGRLPMGAPTSPVLSNIATYKFDKEIERYCKGENIMYTRYVDDMSFSANEIITQRHLEQLSSIIIRYGYVLHPEKVKLFSPSDKKIISGLIVHEGTVSVPPEYRLEVENEIKNLKAYVLIQTRLFPKRQVDYFFSKPAQKIKGALAFIESIHSSDDKNLAYLERQLEEAVEPPTEYESLHWLEIGYTFL